MVIAAGVRLRTQVRFVMDEMALKQIFIRILRFALSISFRQRLHEQFQHCTHLHPDLPSDLSFSSFLTTILYV